MAEIKEGKVENVEPKKAEGSLKENPELLKKLQKESEAG